VLSIFFITFSSFVSFIIGYATCELAFFTSICYIAFGFSGRTGWGSGSF
jgi:hypothetical protein